MDLDRDRTQIPHSRPWIEAADRLAVEKALEAENLSSGRLNEEFEHALSTTLGNRPVWTSSSGTQALTLLLRFAGIGAGNEVILPSYVCVGVLDAILAVGATPVFCDIGENWVATPDQVSPRISPRTKAIIAVHLFGIPCDLRELETPSLLVIEDSCQAFGLNADGVPWGSATGASFFSFEATKCLTTGRGGAFSVSPEYFRKTRAETVQRGQQLRGGTELGEMEAALGLSQLTRYSEFLARRLELGGRYRQELPAGLGLPPESSMNFRFPIRVQKDKETLKKQFAEQGVLVRDGVDALLHQAAGADDKDFGNTLETFHRTVSLPIYPALTRDEQTQVLEVANVLL